MTKDDDFKRVVRRRARESGERYTAVRSQLEAEQPRPDEHWLVVRTIPGAEDEVRQWLARRRELGVTDALIPRFRRRKIAPGVLVLKLEPTSDIDAIAGQPWFVSFVGSEKPRKVDWSRVRSILNACASVAVRAPRTTALLRTPRIEEGRALSEEDRAFETMGLGVKAARKLSAETDTLSQHDQRVLVDQVEAGIRARRSLWDSNRQLVEGVVDQWDPAGIPTEVASSDLMDAGMNGLAEAIDRFCGPAPYRLLLPGTAAGGATRDRFVTHAEWWIRHTIAEYLAVRRPG